MTTSALDEAGCRQPQNLSPNFPVASTEVSFAPAFPSLLLHLLLAYWFALHQHATGLGLGATPGAAGAGLLGIPGLGGGGLGLGGLPPASVHAAGAGGLGGLGLPGKCYLHAHNRESTVLGGIVEAIVVWVMAGATRCLLVYGMVVCGRFEGAPR